MKTITIKTCNDCPNLDHTGNFTPGGAKPQCGLTSKVIPYRTIHNDKTDRSHRKAKGKIPEWCPLQDLKAVLLSSIDGSYDGLYISGKLIAEGHVLGEGNVEKFWLGIAINYGIGPGDLSIETLSDIDSGTLDIEGKFPALLDLFIDKY